eukprot:m.593422 g.593422  ORF g.593422 m.593422 type:complete len:421 (-) comp22393_c0_seq12:510-1772(-)
MRGASQARKGIQAFGKYPINPQTLSKVAAFGDRCDRNTYLQSCSFIWSEGAIRLAHIVREMRALPKVYLKEANILRVHDWYVQSFEELVSVQPHPSTPEEADDFAARVTQSASGMLNRHEPTVMSIAVGMQRLWMEGHIKDVAGTQNFLDRFFMARIGIRFLLSQHLSAFKNQISSEGSAASTPSTTTAAAGTRDAANPSRRWVGSIDRATDVADIADNAAHNAKMLCYEKYSAAPDVIIKTVGKNRDITYIPSHLYHIVFELLKNSCRAVTELYDDTTTIDLPPVEVLIVKGDTDLTIRISDQGGGIPKANQDEIFAYYYSTASRPEAFERAVHDGCALIRTDMNNAPLAGFGYGLPISRLYARQVSLPKGCCTMPLDVAGYPWYPAPLSNRRQRIASCALTSCLSGAGALQSPLGSMG